MKKIVILVLVLVLIGTSASAVDLGHIGVSNKGISTWTVTWKDGLADGLNINAGFGGNGVYIGGQWYLLDGYIADIDWLGWHVGPGVYGFIGDPVIIGGEVFAGIDFYLGPLFNANIPLEVFIDYGIGLEFEIDSGLDFGPNFTNFAVGIRWMFD